MTELSQQHIDSIWTKSALRIADALGRDTMRAVGGCVRDVLLDRPLGDIDFATTHPPDKVMHKLEAAGIAVKATGYDHGTVTAILDNQNFEITSLREDVETHGRRAVVKYTKDWDTDAQRRDFTINALYLDTNGTLYDGSGQGMANLQAKTLRFIGDASTRIQEDYLRILRLFRFVSQLGFTADDAALKASAQEKEGLRVLSGERVTMEWDKLLRGPCVAEALRLMREAGVHKIYPSHPDAIKRIEHLPIHEGTLALRYALVFEGNVFSLPYVFSRRLAAHIKTLLDLRASTMSWQECAFRHDRGLAADLYLWRCVTKNISVDPDVLTEIEGYTIPTSPIRAETYILQGFSGPELGQKVKVENEAWIQSFFSRY